MADDHKYAKLLKWGKENNFKMDPLIQIHSYSYSNTNSNQNKSNQNNDDDDNNNKDMGFGIMANGPISTGQAIIVVPPHCQLSFSTSLFSKVFKYKRKRKKKKEIFGILFLY